MLRRDLIMGQFEAFGKALALLMGLRKQQEWDQFEKELAALSVKYAGKELSILEAMPDDELDIWLKDDSARKLKILASLLYEKMVFYEHISEQEAYRKTGKRCEKLYQALQDNLVSSEFDLDVHYKMKDLANRQFN
jgi:hypothetical protein